MISPTHFEVTSKLICMVHCNFHGPSLHHPKMHLAFIVLPRNDIFKNAAQGNFFYNILKVNIIDFINWTLKIFLCPQQRLNFFSVPHLALMEATIFFYRTLVHLCWNVILVTQGLSRVESMLYSNFYIYFNVYWLFISCSSEYTGGVF